MGSSKYRFTAGEQSVLRRKLHSWFRANQRELPWRVSRDPYAIWVSEVMLQQTQVTTVIPFYLRFLKRFPTLTELAEADEQDVLREWEGLGYYRRARHLHQSAKVIVESHSGIFPANAELARQLPGLGRYTVGAILSQAFDHRLPIVDANVARVLCRLLAWKQELEAKPTQEWLWATAEALLPTKNVGDFNQALMELGQTICTTGEPSCLICPLRDLCRGRASGAAGSLPQRRGKVEPTFTRERAVIIQKQKQVLLCQRLPNAARWANMWEFPTQAIISETGNVNTVQRQSEQLTGIRIRRLKKLGAITYGITRYKVTLEAVLAQFQGGRLHRKAYQSLVWVKPNELGQYPLSVPQRRLAKHWLSGPLPSRE